MAYDRGLYPRRKSGTDWSKIFWEVTPDQIEESRTREDYIYVYTKPLGAPGYAISTTVIRADQQAEMAWIHVFGTKIVDQPVCLEGMYLVRGIELLALFLGKKKRIAATEQRRERAIVACSNYLASMSGNTTSRWKQYGAPYEPLPAQDALNKTLSAIAQSAEIKAIKFQGAPKKNRELKIFTKKSEAKRLQTAIINSIAGEERLPAFWCSQAEIKEFLKRQQGRDAQKVVQSLSILTPQPSVSCSIRRSLRRLSYDRMLQVAFGSVISATRFKIVEGKKMGEVQCPKCGELDNWGRCKDWYQIQVPGNLIEEFWPEAMDKVMNKIRTLNPAMNTKYTDKEVKRQAQINKKKRGSN